MLDQNNCTPLYEQLMKVIKDDISSGVYHAGDRMPSEAEMEKTYQVSRITVRRAVKELCDERILMKKQGKGTFVVDEGEYRDLNTVKGFHDSMTDEGRIAHTKILEKKIVQVKASYAKDLQIAKDAPVVYLKRLMYVNDVPFFIDQAYIPAERFPGIIDKMDGDVSLFRMLKSEYGVGLVKFDKVLKLQKATKEISQLLNCHVGDPLFDLFKLSYDEHGVPQCISISILPGDRTYYYLSNERSDGDEMSCGGLRWKI